MIKGWRYYNHAIIPTTAPHENADTSIILNNKIWRLYKQAILARWTSDFDCKDETNWWYVIKDKPFDISHLKSKRRYEINKGDRFFDVKEIEPKTYSEEIWKITVEAFKTYPKSYRPHISHDQFINGVIKWDFYKTYGAFSKEDGLLCGYACLSRKEMYIDFCTMKALPEKEKFGLNAAMVHKILEDHVDFLKGNGYICDGARSIQHETAFQDYLIKYFEFRKAYCQLHIVYAPKIKCLIKIAYTCRWILKKLDSFSIAKKINSIIKMEEIHRASLH